MLCSGTRTGGTGVADTVVNQLLAKIDGVDALNNILVIGTGSFTLWHKWYLLNQ